ncbi:N-6 DNA methylase [Streptomyces sp. NPDC019937]|uniref:N-6 DNA methylase n=1 Tax=Streptomyces sp. NPDC019937 TaxID=3154787 RepID=UPI00340DD128
MSGDRVEVTSADIARIVGVRPTAVSNWRRRHEGFPHPVGGTERSPRFDLAEVEAWLRQERKAPEIPAGQRLWQALDSVRGVMPMDDALGMTGTLLLHLLAHPDATVPATASGCERLMRTAERSLAESPGARAGVTALLAHCPRYEFGPRQIQLLTAAAAAAASDGPVATFEELCARHFGSGPRAGFAATPTPLADLMVTLAGPGDGTLIDPACGSGSLLLAAADHGYQRVQGQELNASLARIAALRLAFRAAVSGGPTVVYDVHAADFLRTPVYPRKAAAVIGHPPFADRTWGYDELAHSPAWEYGVPPRAESELAWVQQALAHAAPGAPVILLMPPAAATRPSGRRIRAALLQRGALRAVISLPPGYAAHYALPLQIWVMRRPDAADAPSPDHLLVVDASEAQDPAPLIEEIWFAYVNAPEAFAARPGVARTVALVDLLGETDVTPHRHLPKPTQPGVSRDALAAARTAFESAARALRSHLPSELPLAGQGESGPGTTRMVSLGDLVKSGAVVLHRQTTMRRITSTEEPSGPGEARFLTVGDITSGRPPSASGPIPEDPLRHPRVREGDILVPVMADTIVARVATAEDAGAYPDSGVHHLRVTDPELVDPWYLAGYLSSAEGSRQAASATSALGLHARIDPRRVRIPLVPLERQRLFGEAFRSVARFTRALRTVHDLGEELARNSIDALAAEFRVVDTDTRATL